MKKFLKYLCWLPFAVCIGSLLIYIIYTIRIKMNVTIVTEKMTTTLKTYLMISLISLFIGLFIVLIKKIYYLIKSNNNKPNRKFDNKNIKLKDDKKIVIDKEENIDKENNLNIDGVLCPECGSLISKDAIICTHCGILFDKEVLKFLSKKDKIDKKQKKKSNIKVTIINILLIIIFMFLIFLIFNKILNKQLENNKNINSSTIKEKA